MVTPPDDTQQKFDAMKAVQKGLDAKIAAGQPLSDRETAEHMYSCIADVAVMTSAHVQASKNPLKRLFRRNATPAAGLPAARAEAVAGYEKAMASYDASFTQLADLWRARDEVTAGLAEARRQQVDIWLGELETERAGLIAPFHGGTGRDIRVKPLKLRVL